MSDLRDRSSERPPFLDPTRGDLPSANAPSGRAAGIGTSCAGSPSANAPSGRAAGIGTSCAGTDGEGFAAARGRCLQISLTGELGTPFHPPWFDPETWGFDELGRLHGLLPDGLRPEGYRDLVHGGAVAALLDAAMTHCLFGQEILAVTAELAIKFRKPLAVGHPVEVTASVKETIADQLFRLTARVTSDGEVKAEATGTFFRPLDGGPLAEHFKDRQPK